MQNQRKRQCQTSSYKMHMQLVNTRFMKESLLLYNWLVCYCILSECRQKMWYFIYLPVWQLYDAVAVSFWPHPFIFSPFFGAVYNFIKFNLFNGRYNLFDILCRVKTSIEILLHNLMIVLTYQFNYFHAYYVDVYTNNLYIRRQKAHMLSLINLVSVLRDCSMAFCLEDWMFLSLSIHSVTRITSLLLPFTLC